MSSEVVNLVVFSIKLHKLFVIFELGSAEIPYLILKLELLLHPFLLIAPLPIYFPFFNFKINLSFFITCPVVLSGDIISNNEPLYLSLLSL